MLRCRVRVVTVLFLLVFQCIILPTLASNQVENDDSTCSVTEEETCTAQGHDDKNLQRVPDDCQLVMAESLISGWGVFTLRDQSRGQPVFPWGGDVVIHLSDVPPSIHIQWLVRYYVWQGQEMGGQYEGQHVMSVVPGLGMLANSATAVYSKNILPFVPQVDEGGLTRTESPGAGAITHYHNLTYFLTRNTQAGDELLLEYGKEWFLERNIPWNTTNNNDKTSTRRSTEWLRQYGSCLEFIRPGRRSQNKQAGRGAYSTRALPKDMLVSLVPVVPITHRQALNIVRIQQDQNNKDRAVHTRQLLLNYCYGHVNSTLLLYPYAPFVNLINHADHHSTIQPNVALRWFTRQPSSQTKLLQDRTLEELRQLQSNHSQAVTGLLELVAIRDIAKGDELLLDYGSDWQAAWDHHVQDWSPVPGAEQYAPSYVMDDVVKSLRTQTELRDYPYPDNVFTSCFYRYLDHKAAAEDAFSQTSEASKTSTTTFAWNQTRGIYKLDYLRPCMVLAREHTQKGTFFTVQIRNRFGLEPEERLPKGRVHIVKNVPRQAIRFSDKLYTTDQHLENAFRHEIGIEYPDHWLDLA